MTVSGVRTTTSQVAPTLGLRLMISTATLARGEVLEIVADTTPKLRSVTRARHRIRGPPTAKPAPNTQSRPKSVASAPTVGIGPQVPQPPNIRNASNVPVRVRMTLRVVLTAGPADTKTP